MSAVYERKFANWLESRGWVAHRAAGSSGEADIIALTPSRSVIIEVKKTSNPDKKNTHEADNKSQWEHYVSLSHRGYEVVYVVRFTTGSLDRRWLVFPLGARSGFYDYPHILRREDGTERHHYFPEVGGLDQGSFPG